MCRARNAHPLSSRFHKTGHGGGSGTASRYFFLFFFFFFLYTHKHKVQSFMADRSVNTLNVFFKVDIQDLYFRISNDINITTNIVKWRHLKLIIQIHSLKACKSH